MSTSPVPPSDVEQALADSVSQYCAAIAEAVREPIDLMQIDVESLLVHIDAAMTQVVTFESSKQHMQDVLFPQLSALAARVQKEFSDVQKLETYLEQLDQFVSALEEEVEKRERCFPSTGQKIAKSVLGLFGKKKDGGSSSVLLPPFNAEAFRQRMPKGEALLQDDSDHTTP